MSDRLSVERYQQLVDEIHDRLRLYVPPESVILVASKGDERLVRLDRYRMWHFPQTRSGVYAGHHPASSADAIAHMRHLQTLGADYLLFPSTALWWLDHYRELAVYLRSAHETIVADADVCTLFRLDRSTARALDESEIAGRSSDEVDAASDVVPLLPIAPRESAGPLRVLTVLARFGTEQYADAERHVDELFARQLPDADRTTVVVDNARPPGVVEKRRAGWLLGGDNRAREFSAFDRAIDFVGSDLWSYDLVHFTTSAFNTLYVSYLDRFDGAALKAIAGRPVCLGHIDCYNDPIDVFTYRSQHWIRSCFFFLPPVEARALRSLVSVVDGRRFFSGDPSAPFRADAPLCEGYRRYIAKWLTGGDIGQGVTWHSSFALTQETLPAFEEKAVSIVNEQLLGIRLRALGCRLIDITWLSTQLRHKAADEIAWDTPWREQLASRDRDAVLVPGDSQSAMVGAL